MSPNLTALLFSSQTLSYVKSSFLLFRFLSAEGCFIPEVSKPLDHAGIFYTASSSSRYPLPIMASFSGSILAVLRMFLAESSLILPRGTSSTMLSSLASMYEKSKTCMHNVVSLPTCRTLGRH